MLPRAFLPIVLSALAAAPASAAIVHIEVFGVVDFNVIRGNQSGVVSGNSVYMEFEVDSDVFIDSPNFPTRGYTVNRASFGMSTQNLNGIFLNDAEPLQEFYFVLRNNDPAVDGFLLSTNIDFPQPVSVTIPGLATPHELDFLRTFNDGTPLPSLDILDAVGEYDLTNLSSYQWTIGLFGNPGAEYAYQRMRISVIPAPAACVLAAIFPLARRRRRA